MTTKICIRCKDEKTLDKFNKGPRGIRGRHPWCRKCTKEYGAVKYQQNKERYKKNRDNSYKVHLHRVYEYLVSHPCVDCGESDIRVLEFDHRDPSKKLFTVSELTSGQSTKLEDEILKCDVRCANCHKKRTFEMRATIAKEVLTEVMRKQN